MLLTRILHRHCGAVARSPASRRCRPRPPCRTEAIGRLGHYRPACHDRPDATFNAVRRAPLLRFPEFPFSTHRPRRALFPKAAGLRTCPAAAFSRRLPPALSRGPGLGVASPLRFSALRQDQCGVARSADATRQVLRSHRITRRNRRAAKWIVSTGTSVVFWSIRAGAVGETDSSHCDSHARGGPVGPSAISPHLPDRPGWVMRRRVLSRGVPLPAVPGLARPCRDEWSFPLRHARAWRSYASALQTRSFALSSDGAPGVLYPSQV